MVKLSDPTPLFEKRKVYHVPDINNTKNRPAKIVLVYRFANKELPLALQQMLDKLVAACKFKPEDAAYVNAELDPVLLGVIQTTYAPQMVLVFGDVDLGGNLQKLKKNIPYTLNGMRVIYAEAIDNLVTNDREKKALWSGLQKMIPAA